MTALTSIHYYVLNDSISAILENVTLNVLRGLHDTHKTLRASYVAERQTDAI